MYFVDEYLDLNFGQKSQYKYFYSWHIVDDKLRSLYSEEFINKYKGQIYVYLYRGPYTKSCVSTDSVVLVYANDHRMKKLYQQGEIGKQLWFYDETLDDNEMLEYATGKRTDIYEWEDNIKGV